ncbi:MAG: glycosyltransferase [bacterium]|nr:glycosyltransferase [bacterium]
MAISSSEPPRFDSLPPDRVDYEPWRPEGEAAFFQGLDIGLMPLPRNEWTLGKCSYKMLLYLACGVPVVVSPVGMNESVLAQADVGCAADSEARWVDALVALIDDPEGRERRGRNGVALVASHYSVSALSPRLASMLKGVARG